MSQSPLWASSHLQPFNTFVLFHNEWSLAGNPGSLSWVTLQDPQGRRYPVLLTRVMFDCLMSQWGISIRFSKSAANTIMSSVPASMLVSPHSCRLLCARPAAYRSHAMRAVRLVVHMQGLGCLDLRCAPCAVTRLLCRNLRTLS